MSNILLDVEYVEGLKKRIANAENTIKHWQSNYRLVTARADELEARNDDTLAKLLERERLNIILQKENERLKEAIKHDVEINKYGSLDGLLEQT